MFYGYSVFTCMISASGLFHSYGPDCVLVPLFPVRSVLLQTGCGEEASTLSKCTRHMGSQLSLCDRVQKKRWDGWASPTVTAT